VLLRYLPQSNGAYTSNTGSVAPLVEFILRAVVSRDEVLKLKKRILDAYLDRLSYYLKLRTLNCDLKLAPYEEDLRQAQRQAGI